MLMLVSPPVSFFFFSCINICVVQVTGFNERNGSLVAFQVLENKFWLIDIVCVLGPFAFTLEPT